MTKARTRGLVEMISCRLRGCRCNVSAKQRQKQSKLSRFCQMCGSCTAPSRAWLHCRCTIEAGRCPPSWQPCQSRIDTHVAARHRHNRVFTWRPTMCSWPAARAAGSQPFASAPSFSRDALALQHARALHCVVCASGKPLDTTGNTNIGRAPLQRCHHSVHAEARCAVDLSRCAVMEKCRVVAVQSIQRE